MPSSATKSNYTIGVTQLLLAGAFLSTSGVFARHLEGADSWTVLFYRSLFFFLTVFAFVLFKDRGRTWRRYRTLRWIDGLVAVCMGMGFIFYLLSVFSTTVANTVFMLSAGPFLAAILGWIVLRERVSPITWAAMGVAVVGIVVMVSGDLSPSDLEGIGYIGLAVSTFAVTIVTMRAAARRGDPEQADSLPAMSLGGLTALLMCVPFMQTFELSSWNLLMAFGLGATQIGIGFILVTLGTRHVPAAQVPLLMLTETVLAPLWVWLLVNEIPATTTLLGGPIVLIAVAVQGVLGVVQERRAASAPLA